MPTAITVDYDSILTPCKFLEYAAECRSILEILGNTHALDHSAIEIWNTRRGHHIKIPCNMRDIDLIMHQLFLGSDRRREAFNLRRALQGKFRSYFFDAKITSESCFVNERNPTFEGIWKEVFNLQLEEFEQKYKMFRKKKYGVSNARNTRESKNSRLVT